MIEEYFLEYDAFIRSIKRNKDIPHSFLLGAGASISSDIMSAQDCIWEWKKEIYLSQNPNASAFYRDIKNDSVKNSIQAWLDNEGTYPPFDSDNEYSFYAEKAYPIADDRRKFFQTLCEGKEPYVGYKLLCHLSKKEIVKAVWTTNFDRLFVRAATQALLNPIDITLDNADKIFRNQSRNEVLSIALHGDYKYSSSKNTSDELDSQEEVFVDTLERYQNDKNLIVIGYSGRDKSLMNTLNNAFTKKGSGRLYWCGYGHDMQRNVRELILNARQYGREAFFIPTEGFDKTMIHLSKACFEDDANTQEQITAILASSANNELKTTEFSQSVTRTDKHLKSNLHPISFPKEVFQFEIDYGEDKPWATLKAISKEYEICAIPFKGKVFALANVSSINEAFGSRLKNEIIRVPISKHDISKVSSFRSLMLQAIVKTLSGNEILESNLKDKIWFKKSVRTITQNQKNISVHKAIYLSLFFDNHQKFAFLTFKPAAHLVSDAEISTEVKQSQSKLILEKLFNDKYDAFLKEWNTIIFKDDRLKFEYPIDSGNGLEFSISRKTSFAEIMVLDTNYRLYSPQDYDGKLTQHKGIQFLEPQLLFTNNNLLKETRDFHPMRALTDHRPWDFPMNGAIYPNEIQLGVICAHEYSNEFYKFLNELNQKHIAHVNPDYLIDYPGFASAYNIPINIPHYEDTDKWLDIGIDHNQGDIKTIALNLARLITSKIERLINVQGKLTVTIFIPNEWQAYRKYEEEGEVFNLHDYIKAFSASRGVSTQLIEEDTLTDSLKCQIFWWLSLSFYVKALRTPWTLNNTEQDVAYAGIGYSINKINNETDIVIGCSHIYNSRGEGLKYRLSKVDDFTLDHQENPFLSYNDAFQFGVSIRELFHDSMDKLPRRVVVHKRTRFTDDEIKGITESLNMANILRIDLIEINFERDARYMATKILNGKIEIDKFPLSRGTCIVTDKTTALLWTHGIVPSVRNPNFRYYLGGRSIPAPLKITKHYGETNINVIATEILGLTKMNWNSFDLYTKLPATIDSSNQIARIGKLLSRFEGKTYDYRLFI